jgi:hypothetical protein
VTCPFRKKKIFQPILRADNSPLSIIRIYIFRDYENYGSRFRQKKLPDIIRQLYKEINKPYLRFNHIQNFLQKNHLLMQHSGVNG